MPPWLNDTCPLLLQYFFRVILIQYDALVKNLPIRIIIYGHRALIISCILNETKHCIGNPIFELSPSSETWRLHFWQIYHIHLERMIVFDRMKQVLWILLVDSHWIPNQKIIAVFALSQFVEQEQAPQQQKSQGIWQLQTKAGKDILSTFLQGYENNGHLQGTLHKVDPYDPFRSTYQHSYYQLSLYPLSSLLYLMYRYRYCFFFDTDTTLKCSSNVANSLVECQDHVELC